MDLEVPSVHRLISCRSSRHLPVNFEHIALSKLQIDRLQTAGIAYDKVTGHRVDGQFDAIVDDGSSD